MLRMRLNLTAVLPALLVIAGCIADAKAMYNPSVGRFVQRDPGASKSIDDFHFLPRDQYTEEEISVSNIQNNYSMSGDYIYYGVAYRSKSDIYPEPVNTLSQYKDGMGLYQYLVSNPLRNKDPKGTNIYLAEGNFLPKAGAINREVHQKVCVDTYDEKGCKSLNSRCFSFGKVGWAFRFGSRPTWLDWNSRTLGGLVMIGEIYEDDNRGRLVEMKKTNRIQDRIWLKYMLQHRVGKRDVYSLARHNCRKYAQWEYRDAP